MYTLYSTVGGWDFGIQEYPALNSFGMVAGFDVVGKIMRCTEYRMYKKRDVLMGVAKSNEKGIFWALFAMENLVSLMICRDG